MKVWPGIGGDADLDPVRQHLRAAGHGGAIAARLANDRRRLAGDRRLVDRGDAFDDLAVRRDELARLDHHHVVLAEARWPAPSRSGRPDASRLATVSVRALRSVSAWALPRPSAIASAKFANSTVSHSQNVICSSKPSPGPAGDGVERETHGRQDAADLDDEHHRVLRHRARVELAAPRRRSPCGRSPDPRSSGPSRLCLRAIRTPGLSPSAGARRSGRG